MKELFLGRAGEDRHRGFVGGRDAMAVEDAPHREEENLDVEPEGLVIDIPNIEREFFFPRNGVAAVDLRPASEAGTNVVPTRLFFVVEGQVLHEQRTRADETHVAFEYEEKFRKLIEGSCAEPLSEGRETDGVGQESSFCVALIGHGAEFDEAKNFAVKAGTFLAEENGRADFLADEEREDEDDRSPKWRGDADDEDVEEPLH